ncbi:MULTISPECIES: phage holin family protein [Pseudomonas aeruginosa group]|uniref:phage holin family protein n=1 Tax=Pseudomonas aeruginosa group TaxID=136841 RepID=UPI00070C64F6|nr:MULTISPECIES: phage holin family protein [Pseudomonas aeruginosa group]MDG9855644.1 holin [Pseudomonas nitroreducens]
MPNEQQALAEMPVWVLILLAIAGGISGELWRADKAGLGFRGILRRLALRSGASVVCGVAVLLLAQAAGAPILVAGALGSLTAAAGAEVAVGLYERWAAKRLGVCEVPPSGTGRGDPDSGETAGQ